MSKELKIKNILLGVIILIGILTMTGLISLLIVFFEDRGFFDSIKIESILGAFILGGMGALTYFTKKFVDTRSNQEKDAHKERMRVSKLKYKLDKYTIKMNNKK